MAFKAIYADIDAQFVEELDEYYVRYKSQTIKMMFTQLRTSYVITTKEKLVTKTHFLAPWSDTPQAHVTTFARQLGWRQVECKDHGVMVTDDDNVDHFVDQMYACGLFKAKFLDNWEETVDNLWRATQPLFMWQFNKEWCQLERENAQKKLREQPRVP